jgi:hypothetical protein
VRIVNDQQIRTTASDRTTHTRSKVLTALTRLPATSSLRIRTQIHIWKYLTVYINR